MPVNPFNISLDATFDAAYNSDAEFVSGLNAVLGGQNPTPTPPTFQQGAEKMRGMLYLERVGTDVEVFLVDQGKNPVPCVGIIKGTKTKPRPILGGHGFAVQEDNVALEYNIPAEKDAYAFVYNLMRVQEAIVEEVKNYGLAVACVPSMRFTKEQLSSKQARTSGCDPDFNVWERKVNDTVKLDDAIRGAGGHIHVSFTVGKDKPTMPEFLSEIETLVMALDITVGAPLTLIDKDVDRRKFYGKAGAFRAREYGPSAAGLEYRVPSNIWTTSPKLAGWTFAQVEKAIDISNRQGAQAHNFFKKYREKVEKAINGGDVASAQRLCTDFGTRLPV